MYLVNKTITQVWPMSASRRRPPLSFTDEDRACLKQRAHNHSARLRTDCRWPVIPCAGASGMRSLWGPAKREGCGLGPGILVRNRLG